MVMLSGMMVRPPCFQWNEHQYIGSGHDGDAFGHYGLEVAFGL